MSQIFQYAPMALLQGLAAFAAFTAGVLAWKRRERAPGVLWLVLTLWVSAFWCLMGTLELSFFTLEPKVIASQLSYLSITTTPILLWRFAHDYTHVGKEPNPTVLLLLGIHVVVTNLMVFTNPLHHWLWSDIRLVDIRGLNHAIYERGPWFWVNMSICYVLSLWTSVMVLVHAFASQRAARLQNAIILLALMCPWGMSIVYIFRVPYLGDVDNTPVGFAAAGLLLSWNMRWLGLFKSVPFVGNVLLERMPDPVLVTDQEGDLVLANPAAMLRFGVPAEGFRSRAASEALARHPAMRTALQDSIARECIPFEEDGSHWEMLSSSISDSHGRVRGRLHVLRETTSLRRALAIADANAERARRANEAKSFFIAQVSHDLRTPMHAILGSVDLAQDTQAGQQLKKELGMIRQAAGSLLSLVDGLLDISRVEAGRIVLDSREFELVEVFDPVVHLLGVLAAKKGIELRQTIAPSAAGLLRGDPERLRRIVQNLVGNAIKFTQHGEVLLSAEADPADPSLLRITVKDTGPGIAADRINSIFNAYDRGDPEVASRHDGTGLGLAISQRLVEAMNGRISVESELGKGASFIVKVPLLGKAQPASLSALMEDDGAELPSRRVILADDDSTSRRVTEALLKRCNCDVEPVPTGSEVLARVKVSPYDLVVLDGWMPGVDGWETCRRLKAEGFAVKIPIIALSADLTPEAISRWKEAGATLVLPKPLPQDTLRSTLLSLKTPHAG